MINRGGSPFRCECVNAFHRKPPYLLLAGKNVNRDHNAEHRVIDAREDRGCNAERAAENAVGIIYEIILYRICSLCPVDLYIRHKILRQIEFFKCILGKCPHIVHKQWQLFRKTYAGVYNIGNYNRNKQHYKP